MKSNKDKNKNNLTISIKGGLFGALLGTLFGIALYQILLLYIEDMARTLQISELLIWALIALIVIVLLFVFFTPKWISSGSKKRKKKKKSKK